MTQIYVIREMGGEWSDSWTINICARYTLSEAEDTIKELVALREKANKDAQLIEDEQCRWETEHDHLLVDYEEIPLINPSTPSDYELLAKIIDLNKSNKATIETNDTEYYRLMAAHLKKFCEINNLTTGGNSYFDSYFSIDTIEIK